MRPCPLFASSSYIPLNYLSVRAPDGAVPACLVMSEGGRGAVGVPVRPAGQTPDIIVWPASFCCVPRALAGMGVWLFFSLKATLFRFELAPGWGKLK